MAELLKYVKKNIKIAYKNLKFMLSYTDTPISFHFRKQRVSQPHPAEI